MRFRHIRSAPLTDIHHALGDQGLSANVPRYIREGRQFGGQIFGEIMAGIV